MDPAWRAPCLARGGRPRPRGDGPVPGALDGPGTPSPPPTRGWTQSDVAGAGAGGVAPAHAGMDLSQLWILRPDMCRPRPRGDGPYDITSQDAAEMSPPPTRGWTAAPYLMVGVPQVAPAHAGMDPPRGAPSCPTFGRPRPRGDGPAGGGPSCAGAWSPPPTRGWTRWDQQCDCTLRVAPAHAGMDPMGPTMRLHPEGRPRPRGDGPGMIDCGTPHAGSPPPTRGWTPGHRHPRQGGGVAPAHAGMDRSDAVQSAVRYSRPRPRGDGPYAALAQLIADGSPPPTRGWTRRGRTRPPPPPVAPAHAGMDLLATELAAKLTGRPRPRGDGPGCLGVQPPGGSSPPPTRGWTCRTLRLLDC